MMAEPDDDEKSHAPSQKRLDDARAKGQIARSADLTSAVALTGFVIAFAILAPTISLGVGEKARILLAEPEHAPAASVALQIVVEFSALLILPAIPVLALLAAQRGLTVTPQNLAPRLSRIDPLAAARRRFGAEGLVDFAKGVAKLALISAAIYWLLSDRMGEIIASTRLQTGPLVSVLSDLVGDLMLLCLAIGLSLGVLDYLWQIKQHLDRNRMSRREMVDEHRETEGDPHAKSARRQRGQEIAMNRMLADVPSADVVVVNPTHFAVALKWNRGTGRAPICVAKGKDLIAARIRSTAVAHGVPVHSDPPTARAIFATVEIGEQIRPEHYRAVAAAIRIAEALRRKKRMVQ